MKKNRRREKQKLHPLMIYAILMLIVIVISGFLKLIDVQSNLLRCLEFNGKEIINRRYYAPEVFKVVINEQNEIIDISNVYTISYEVILA